MIGGAWLPSLVFVDRPAANNPSSEQDSNHD